jgi:hypothetical protein
VGLAHFSLINLNQLNPSHLVQFENEVFSPMNHVSWALIWQQLFYAFCELILSIAWIVACIRHPQRRLAFIFLAVGCLGLALENLLQTGFTFWFQNMESQNTSSRHSVFTLFQFLMMIIQLLFGLFLLAGGSMIAFAGHKVGPFKRK